MMNQVSSTVRLNNGVNMPQLGLGVWQASEGGEVEKAIDWALEAGYRHIDTATIYQNEEGVGRAIRESGIPRSELFITTKLWNADQREGRVEQAYQESLDRLGLDYVDLYLIHWPLPGRFVEAWTTMEIMYEKRLMRAIGVSNFLIHHLRELLHVATIVPAVNQVEFHPWLVQPELLAFNQSHGIQHEAWSPLMQGRMGEVELLQEIGKRYDKSPAQIVLRWDFQKGVVTIPKSVHKSRIIENAGLFDFELTDSEVQAINGLDRQHRLGPNPDEVTF